MSCDGIKEGTDNERKSVIGIWHSLVSPQLGQTTFCAFFAFELFIGELPVGFGPASGLSRRRLCIRDDGFGKGLEVGMRPRRILVFPPDFDYLDVSLHIRQTIYLRSGLVITNNIVLAGDFSQIFVTRTKEPSIEIVFLTLSSEHGHLVDG